MPVQHDGNQTFSMEEVDCVERLVQSLFRDKGSWTDGDGVKRLLDLKDILIIAPYNSQVFELKRRLPAQARIGTVDKFQGQEAPLVIYSMTTSDPEDAPRGMEFLYSLNRLNVVTSRARCMCVTGGDQFPAERRMIQSGWRTCWTPVLRFFSLRVRQRSIRIR